MHYAQVRNSKAKNIYWCELMELLSSMSNGDKEFVIGIDQNEHAVSLAEVYEELSERFG